MLVSFLNYAKRSNTCQQSCCPHCFSFMLRKIVCSAINDYLGLYIDEIHYTDVTTSLVQGELILRNIVSTVVIHNI